MTRDQLRSVPEPTLRRMPAYYHVLKKMAAQGRPVVSCSHLARELSLDSNQIRKDLNYTDIVGKPKVGYEVPLLIDAIERFLGWQNTTDAFLVGAGNLGRALLGYQHFNQYGLNIIAAFDRDASVAGRRVQGKEVFPLERMVDLAQRMHVNIGILTVPGEAAQDVANLMVLSGIRAIWNFAPVRLELPPDIIVQNEDLYASFAVLSRKLAAQLQVRD